MPEGSSRTANREGALQSSTPARWIWGVVCPSTRRASSRAQWGLNTAAQRKWIRTAKATIHAIARAMIGPRRL